LSNTTKTGTPNEGQVQKQQISIRVIVWSILAFALAIFVATQVIGVLYAILFPPDGPALPLNVAEISHRSEAYGVDYWVYGTDQNACEVMMFFAAQSETCQTLPVMCSGPDGVMLAESSPAQQVGSCTGDMDFSIFRLRWEVRVSSHHLTGGTTHFTVLREVLWQGTHAAETVENTAEATAETTAPPP
jgi:hypothetical protein